ncbi:fungal-specific transcription factor domain-containing protein [Xylaria digitata]|nr:fungal-specific transcription factor domain-containing protein [Xylaria digitata]
MPASPLGPELWNHTTIQYSASPDVPADPLTADITPPANPGGGVSPSCSETAAAWDLCRLHNQSAPIAAVDLGPLENALLTTTSDPTQYRRHMSRASVSSMIQSPQGSWPVGNDSSLGSPMASPVSSPVAKQERFLLYHYMHRVVHLFSVIDNAKTPWKTIHLPRVLQCVGELSIAGSTSRIRDALTRTVLSISAFSISNDCKARSCAEEASQWEDSATRFRGDAIGLLKQAVEADLYSSVRPRYKEFLATMLSMITINVMSGETSTCGVHLDGAEQLIKHMSIRKRRFSKEAKSLHRIYYYLRVIYESTAAIETPMSASSVQDNPAIEMDTYEFIYGLPQRLLILLKETIELISLVDDARGKSGSSFIPEELSISCDELERNILDWPLEEQLVRCQSLHAEINSKIIYHQTRSFYHALVIYFSQNIRLLSYRYLRQYIETVLESIEAIENIKTQTNTLAAPLFWPAFIAATEAFDKAHQERFRTWHNAVEVYGFAAARTGIEVVNQIWKQGPSSNKSPMSDFTPKPILLADKAAISSTAKILSPENTGY